MICFFFGTINHYSFITKLFYLQYNFKPPGVQGYFYEKYYGSDNIIINIYGVKPHSQDK